jgi:hypothetical protein
MNSPLRTQLIEAQSKLEAALKTLASEYRRDKEARELKYKRDKRTLEQALRGVQQAVTSENEDSAPTAAIHEGVDRVDAGQDEEGISPTPGKQDATKTSGFSLRREIEKLLLEFGPGQDITQGKVRQRLEERFPEHKESLRPAAVYSGLRRIAKAGGLVLVSEGSGSTPNRYRLPEHGEDNRSQEELSALRE